MSLLVRIGGNVARRIVRPSARLFSDKVEDKREHFSAADPIEHATGLEKKLRLLEEKGILDPFFMEPVQRRATTRDDPMLVPSFEGRRVVGCQCEEDATYLNYMWINKEDGPKRCECGYWFKCVDAYDHFKDVENAM